MIPQHRMNWGQRWEVEAGRSEVQGHLELHIEFKTGLGLHKTWSKEEEEGEEEEVDVVAQTFNPSAQKTEDL